jgi:hypothetical protein
VLVCVVVKPGCLLAEGQNEVAEEHLKPAISLRGVSEPLNCCSMWQ